MEIKLKKKSKTFEGETLYYEHQSLITKTPMRFSAFVPGAGVESAIIWLSGLTCNEENFITKAGAQKCLKDSRTMILCPDTSPRGLDLPGEHESYDFGSGAGFYLNAETEGYKDHYRMYDYIAKEIVDIIKQNFGTQKISITGHSMGGHGALTLGLRERDLFSSVSAFSPVVNPVNCPWGQKAFKNYLGENTDQYSNYDATELVKKGHVRKDIIFIDQGLSDEFLKEQLLTKNFESACKEKGQEVIVKYREGYDHSYFYIASFIEEHIKFHLNALI